MGPQGDLGLELLVGVMTDGGYQGNPEVIMPFRKTRDGSGLPEWKEDLNATHRKIHARD